MGCGNECQLPIHAVLCQVKRGGRSVEESLQRAYRLAQGSVRIAQPRIGSDDGGCCPAPRDGDDAHVFFPRW